MSTKIHVNMTCIACEEKTVMQDESLMVFKKRRILDDLDIGIYECPTCHHQVEVLIDVEL